MDNNRPFLKEKEFKQQEKLIIDAMHLLIFLSKGNEKKLFDNDYLDNQLHQVKLKLNVTKSEENVIEAFIDIVMANNFLYKMMGKNLPFRIIIEITKEELGLKTHREGSEEYEEI